MGLECDPDIEILEFGEMIGATENKREENGQVPPELNSSTSSLKPYYTSKVNQTDNSVLKSRVQLPWVKVQVLFSKSTQSRL